MDIVSLAVLSVVRDNDQMYKEKIRKAVASSDLLPDKPSSQTINRRVSSLVEDGFLVKDEETMRDSGGKIMLADVYRCSEKGQRKSRLRSVLSDMCCPLCGSLLVVDEWLFHEEGLLCLRCSDHEMVSVSGRFEPRF